MAKPFCCLVVYAPRVDSFFTAHPHFNPLPPYPLPFMKMSSNATAVRGEKNDMSIKVQEFTSDML